MVLSYVGTRPLPHCVPMRGSPLLGARRDCLPTMSLYCPLPCHMVNCANLCSVWQPRAEPKASRLTAVAVVELGTVTSIPQSRNYHHSAWVSDLEPGMARPALPPAASRPTTGGSPCGL